jgi:CubicO group peptidase (beta-lactamase class C family)
MKGNRYKGMLVLLVALGSAVPASHGEAVDDATDAIDNYAAQKIPSGVFYARSPVVGTSGHFGQASPDRAIDDQTSFNIGSISKSFLAYLIVKQSKQGLINLQDPVSRSFPLFRHREVTWHHLLTHTSGLPDFQELAHDVPLDLNIFAVVNQARAKSKPGTEFRYSSLGYFILEEYLQFSHRKPIAEILQQEIFTPLGMKQTFDLAEMDLDSNVAFGTFLADGVPRFTTPESRYQGNVQIYSSVSDLEIYFREGLLNDRLGLGETHLKEIFSSHDFNYGYGWVVHETAGERTVSHGGQSPGYSAYLRYNMDQDVLTIALSNREHVNLPEANWNMENLLLGRELTSVGVPRLFAESKSSETLEERDISGTFVSSGGEKIVIVKEGSDFLLNHGELSNKILIRRDDVTYIVRVEEGGFLSLYPVVVQLGEGDRVTSVLWDATEEFVKQ